jgi:hypothetical protein
MLNKVDSENDISEMHIRYNEKISWTDNSLQYYSENKDCEEAFIAKN